MKEDSCVFCKIAKKHILASVVMETDNIFAFNDITPVAPVHVLIIPKIHISSLNEVAEENQKILSEIVLVAKKIAVQKGIADSGYRLVYNCNQNAGQSVFHVHCHLLGGKMMGWPPFPNNN